MRSYKFWFIAGLDLLVLAAGFACIFSVKYGGAARSPWWLLGIVLIALGAAGAVATVAMQAMRVETEEAHPAEHGSAADRASDST